MRYPPLPLCPSLYIVIIMYSRWGRLEWKLVVKTQGLRAEGKYNGTKFDRMATNITAIFFNDSPLKPPVLERNSKWKLNRYARSADLIDHWYNFQGKRFQYLLCKGVLFRRGGIGKITSRALVILSQREMGFNPRKLQYIAKHIFAVSTEYTPKLPYKVRSWLSRIKSFLSVKFFCSINLTVSH